jgi:hypothetical protein
MIPDVAAPGSVIRVGVVKITTIKPMPPMGIPLSRSNVLYALEHLFAIEDASVLGRVDAEIFRGPSVVVA